MRIDKRVIVVAIIATFSFGWLSGCGFQRPAAVVVSQADPSPLRGAKSYRVAEVTFDGLTFDGEPESKWLAGRSDKQRRSWENDKAHLTERLMKRFGVEAKADEDVTLLGGSAKSDELVLSINVDSFRDSTFTATLRVLDGEGHIVDRIVLPVRYGGQFIYGVDSMYLSLTTFVAWAPADTLSYLRDRRVGKPGGKLGKLRGKLARGRRHHGRAHVEQASLPEPSTRVLRAPDASTPAMDADVVELEKGLVALYSTCFSDDARSEKCGAPRPEATRAIGSLADLAHDLRARSLPEGVRRSLDGLVARIAALRADAERGDAIAVESLRPVAEATRDVDVAWRRSKVAD